VMLSVTDAVVCVTDLTDAVVCVTDFSLLSFRSSSIISSNSNSSSSSSRNSSSSCSSPGDFQPLTVSTCKKTSHVFLLEMSKLEHNHHSIIVISDKNDVANTVSDIYVRR
jgi:hypothetical protein